MIPGGRGIADRPTIPPRHAPAPPTRCLGCAIALSIALWTLLILAGVHLYARVFA